MTVNITIHKEKNDSVWREASEFLLNWLKLYHNITQKTLLLLSGGSVVRIYTDLAEFIKTSGLNFDYLAIGQIDERFQPENKEDINAYQIEKTGFWIICREKKIPHYLILQKGSLEEAGEKYNQTISKLFKEYQYKIGILGIGEDAHTAGLIPGYEKEWNKDKFAVGFKNSGKFPRRISITPKALKILDQTIVAASGDGKKEAIKKAFDPENAGSLNTYPAAILQQVPRVDLFTDAEGLQKF